VPTLKELRTVAVSNSFFQPTSLKSAIERLGFVQADPIRAPARAQDLILRHRVDGYRQGDLDEQYPNLDLEEDTIYAYGFVPRRVWQLLQPRKTDGLRILEKKVLEAVSEIGETHPRDLQIHLGNRRVVNAWGGYSAATTQTLENLRHRGLLRIVRRENGIRLYEPARPFDVSLTPKQRLEQLILKVAALLAPSPEKSLRAVVSRYRQWGDPRESIDALLKNGDLERHVVEGIAYLSPPFSSTHSGDNESRRVRFLAPFDPLIWDRRRFEHFWGWAYRFEAYTPESKRVRGYYAMPTLWGDKVIGWVNIAVSESGLSIQVGFISKRPSDRSFTSELEREIQSFKAFLGLPLSTRTNLVWP
jgi:uncharacterized protein YcaQ